MAAAPPDPTGVAASNPMKTRLQLSAPSGSAASGTSYMGEEPLPSEEMLLCVDTVLHVLHLHMGELQPRAVANSLWAVSKLATSPSLGPFHHPLRRACHQMAQALLPAVSDALPHFEPQHISNAFYSLALLQSSRGLSPDHDDQRGHELHNSLLIGLQGHSRPLLDQFHPQALSNTIYALALLGQEPEEGRGLEWYGSLSIFRSSGCRTDQHQHHAFTRGPHK